MQIRLTVLAGIGVLTLAATAGGYALGRDVAIRPSDTATFGQGWRCHYPRKGDVDCHTGDATPYVQLLTQTLAGPLTLKVRATVGSTHVRKVRRRVCREPTRCWYEDTYTFSGGAGG
jgi:hypothetical protein